MPKKRVAPRKIVKDKTKVKIVFSEVDMFAADVNDVPIQFQGNTGYVMLGEGMYKMTHEVLGRPDSEYKIEVTADERLKKPTKPIVSRTLNNGEGFGLNTIEIGPGNEPTKIQFYSIHN